jgi:hypothetical protein
MSHHSGHRLLSGRGMICVRGWLSPLCLVFFLGYTTISLPADAQPQPTEAGSSSHVCQKTTDCAAPTGASLSQDCDVRYRNLQLTYDGNTACEKAIRGCTGADCGKLFRSYEGARSSKPPRHITTPLASIIADYSPFLFYNLNLEIEESETEKQNALRNLYRGTSGSSRDVYAMAGGGGADGDTGLKLANCVNQIETPSNPTSREEWAKLVRLRVDNCTNQFILQSAIDPAYKENTKKYSMENIAVPTEKLKMSGQCQPLTMRVSGHQTMNEYSVSYYLQGAWKKLLQDPRYRISLGAAGAGNEPSLPLGTRINNPIALPAAMPDVRLSMLMGSPYEEIIDPSHPFSPRWDFPYNERDFFSPLTREYSGDDKNSVFCAGDKNKKILKVDVLSFRDKRIDFTTKVTQRIAYNLNCKNNVGIQRNPCCGNVKVQYHPLCPNQGPPTFGKCPVCKSINCGTCFDMSADSPPCSTTYSGTPDRKNLQSSYLPVRPELRPAFDTYGGFYPIHLLGFYPTIAACTPLEPIQNTRKMADMCKDLREPLIPINKLKMRYHDPEKLSESELPSGVPEGLSFKEYFGSNMPYMRLLDTGRSIQKSRNSQQDPMDDLGQYTAIVGVGKEAISGNSNAKDERCLLGGWGGPASFGGVSINAPDPITSWTELKLYQTRTARGESVYCIGRYEKTFKTESTEEKILGLAGGEFNALRALPGKTEKTSMSKIPWPLSWRGYLIEPDTRFQFPNFSKSASGISTGIDNAKLGDILILPRNGSGNGRPPGLPRLAIVVEGGNNDAACQDEGSCWVNVLVADDGNTPDVCGTTDAKGQALSRTFYKPDFSENLNKDDFQTVGASTDCEDQNLQKCVLGTWDSIKVYRIREDRQMPQATGTPQATGGAP